MGGRLLRLEYLTRRFGDTLAVDRVDLRIPRPQMIAVIGRSGAGKSTTLRLINRLIDPTEGKIYFGDGEVTALRGRALRAWRSRCAMIFQQFNLSGRLDVITNVMVGCLGDKPLMPSMMKWFGPAERAEAVRALDRVDLLPQALQRAETLSGGQQQRVAIARALLQRPHLILADEPVASLDPANAARVMETLVSIHRDAGISVLCNLHDLGTARSHCERIIGMAAGRIVFDGPPESLTPDAVRRIYGVSEAELDLETAGAAAPRKQKDGQPLVAAAG